MAFFNSFTDSIRQKWLQFFQVNHDWITLHMKAESVYTPDGGKRPPSYLILGVVNALEPKLAQLMLPFSKLNPDADTLIEVLDLHFDPDIALGNRFMPPIEPEAEQYEPTIIGHENPEDETLAISHTNGFAREAMAQEFAIQESHNELGDISLNSSDQSYQTSSMQADDFSEISFDTTTASKGKLDEQILDELNTQEENAFSDVLSDVWGDQTALQKGEDNNDFLGEELPAGVFDESEIARLFPNA
ncbi:DUF5331 domain-containing protein [Halotia branconii]|uniref:DUF5331 domain-containing protein n=1 Tax=Halotia branconii CENA392 TaxID=1539056 RepID=A0AAJ6NMV2_9CYAN|nr:DUF5331 domain-containing protein [Halotia branconii]WGV23443.1 DUF5331 domain-containing protein [Halotia branconii CENA392]